MEENRKLVAVIDIGSNSIKLLVAATDENGGIDTIHFETDETRIGGFLGGESQEMTKEAMRAGVMSVESLVKKAGEYYPERVAIIATSAVRDAQNQEVFCRWIQEVTGGAVDILSGEEEARLVGLGVSCDPALKGKRDFYQMDQGGGSLELVEYRNCAHKNMVSLPLGAVRLFRQFQSESLEAMTSKQMNAIADWVDEWIGKTKWLAGVKTPMLVGTGGALTLTRVTLAQEQGKKLADFSPVLTREQLDSFFQRIAALSVEDRVKKVNLPVARADILPASLAAILRVMHHFEAKSIVHSFYNLRYGYAYELLFSKS